MSLRFFALFHLFVLFAATGCQTLKESSKHGFTEGYFKGKVFHAAPSRVYITPGDDSIKVYAIDPATGVVDTGALSRTFPLLEHGAPAQPAFYFRQNTLDIDLLSILIKYRPVAEGFPNQFNTSILNGAVYLGYRSDLYHLRYRKTPFATYKREITHYGVSVGVFTGLGASKVDPFVTLNRIDIEYEGLVNPSGVAAFLAFNRLSFGLMVGVDHLLDKNRKLWIYQGKPWVGLGVGLHVN
jgi:hypothetical protein